MLIFLQGNDDGFDQWQMSLASLLSYLKVDKEKATATGRMNDPDEFLKNLLTKAVSVKGWN